MLKNLALAFIQIQKVAIYDSDRKKIHFISNKSFIHSTCHALTDTWQRHLAEKVVLSALYIKQITNIMKYECVEK